MSLQLRLLAVLTALAVAGLVAADIVTYLSIRSFLVERVDRTVSASTQALSGSLARRGRLDTSDLIQLASSTPGVYLGLMRSDGSASWSPIGVRPGESPPPRRSSPTGCSRPPGTERSSRSAPSGARPSSGPRPSRSPATPPSSSPLC